MVGCIISYDLGGFLSVSHRDLGLLIFDVMGKPGHNEYVWYREQNNRNKKKQMTELLLILDRKC